MGVWNGAPSCLSALACGRLFGCLAPILLLRVSAGLSALGLEARAVKSFATALQLEPEFWQAHYLLGVEMANQGGIGKAQGQFMEVIRYRPDFAPAHFYLGISLAAQKKPAQVLAEFRTVLQLDPADSSARQEIAPFQASGNSSDGSKPIVSPASRPDK
jgi:cytochrome c-type biogenesis protein CcmH/NrfG